MELPWVASPNYSPGRGSYPLNFIVVHSTEGPATPGMAMSLARNWFALSSTGTSAHAMFDPSGGVEMVKPGDTAWHCGNGNQGGYGIEHCGYAAWSPAQWAAVDHELRLSAQWAAQICKIYGIPVRRLTLEQLRNREKGFCTHKDVRDALGGTTHVDPGPSFPMDLYLSYVRQAMGGSVITAPVEKDWFDMATKADLIAALKDPSVLNAIAEHVVGHLNDEGYAGHVVGLRNGLNIPSAAENGNAVWDAMNDGLRKSDDFLWRLGDAVVRRFNQQGNAKGLNGLADALVNKLNDRGYESTLYGLGKGLGLNPPAKQDAPATPEGQN